MLVRFLPPLGGLQWFRNVAGTFATGAYLVQPSAAAFMTHFTVADINNDGLPDLVYNRDSDVNFFWQRNTGGGILDATVNSVATVRTGQSLALISADFDGDGWEDVLAIWSSGLCKCTRAYLQPRTDWLGLRYSLHMIALRH